MSLSLLFFWLTTETRHLSIHLETQSPENVHRLIFRNRYQLEGKSLFRKKIETEHRKPSCLKLDDPSQAKQDSKHPRVKLVSKNILHWYILLFKQYWVLKTTLQVQQKTY